MDVSTKERLTGALIVVLALVVVAPELLSGRHAPESGTPVAQNPEDGAPLQTFSVQLDHEDSVLVDAAAVPAATAESESVMPPVIAEPSPPVEAPAERSRPAARLDQKPGSPPAAAPAAPATPARTPAPAATGKWWVQTGSFESRDNAQRLARQLRSSGFTTDVAQGSRNGKDLFRVRAGPVADRAAAEALRSRLVAAGQKNPTVIAP